MCVVDHGALEAADEQRRGHEQNDGNRHLGHDQGQASPAATGSGDASCASQGVASSRNRAIHAARGKWVSRSS